MEAVGDRGIVVAGVHGAGWHQARRWAEQAAEAGAAARACCCRRTPTGPTTRAVVEHYREVAAVGLPIVAYNNPIDTKVDLTPALLAELYDEGLIVGGQGVHRRRRGGPTRSPSSRRASTCSIGSDDSVLESAVAGAKGWVAGYPNAFPRACVELYRGCVGRRPRRPALPLYRPLHPLLRWDSKTEFVQAIKLSHGHGRPLRRPVPPAAPAADRRAGRRARPRARPRRRCAAGCALTPCAPRGSSTPSTPTPRACRPGSSPAASGVHPGRHDGRAAPVLHGQPATTSARC